MGWAKYAEDNFEIYLERMDVIYKKSARRQIAETETHCLQEQTDKKNDSLSRKSAEKSCFSLHKKTGQASA